MSTNLCINGNMQSPIDIKSNNIIQCGAMCDLLFYYRGSKCNLINIGDSIVMDYDTGSYITYNSQVYELHKISFSIPAAHKIDDFAYPGEIQLYHRSPDIGEVLIISIFLDTNDARSRSLFFFDMFANILPKTKGTQRSVNTSDSWSIYNVIPEQKSFYSYKGSLIRSPCTENVQWLVFDNAVNCSVAFFDKLKQVVKSNVRPIQKLNGRKVYYNANTGDKNKRNYGDRLRCYNDKEFREQCGKLTGNKDLVDAKNRQAMLGIIAFCVVLVTILFILWLVQQDFFTNTGKKIKAFFDKKLNLTRKTIKEI